MELIQFTVSECLRRAWPAIHRQVLYCVLFVFIFSFSPLNLFAQGSAVYTVTGLHVDVTSTSSVDARSKALAEGQQRAFKQLLHRLIISNDNSRLPEYEPAIIDEYVRDFAVDNERNSPIRYLADLTFRFKPRKVRVLLRELEIQFAETVSKPVLVLPIYEESAAKVLWDTPNPWKEAWDNLKLSGGLVPILLPRGDRRDIGTIGAEQAVEGDKLQIQAIGKRYNVATVSVAFASMTIGPEGSPVIHVSVISYGSDDRASTVRNTFMLGSGESMNSLLVRAAKVTAITMEDLWKDDNLIKFEQGSVLAATLPITGLTDWVSAKRRLYNIAIIERIDLVLISRKEVRINIFYLGEVEQLSLALAQADLGLKEEEGNWILKLRKLSSR